MKKRKMAIEIKEYVGHEFVSVNHTPTKLKNMTESSVETYIDENSLMVDIEAIHSRVTRNNTYYSPECLKDSVPYWTNPYERPVIMHHNEKDGVIIGRIKSVEYKEAETRTGTPALVFTANIGDEEGKKGIKNGTLSTVSICVIAHDLRCSICGTNLAEEGLCEHEKGETYDGKLCYWIINKMEPKEVSYVIVPSDIYAHNTKTMKSEDYLKTTKTNKDFKESLINLNEGVTNMSVENKNLTEGQIIDETVKDGEEITQKPEAKEEEKAPEVNKKEESKKESKEESKEEKKESETPEVDPKDKEIEELKAKIEKIETEKESVTKELVALKKELEDSVKKVEEITVELNSKETELKQEVELKEAVEKELENAKLEIRESKENELYSLRRSLNKPVLVKEALTARSDESLRDAICDLKEELEGIANLKNVQKANDPTILSEKNENNVKPNVKESKTVGNIKVEEGLTDIFSSMFDRRFI